jgi:hypothetical protein
MPKRQAYVTLEISHDRLVRIVNELRDKLLAEFWSHVPEGSRRDAIKARLEASILAALERQSSDIEAT